MAFRFVNSVPQFLTVDGHVLAGGNLYFTDSGTSNPRPTYADPALSAENTNPVILDASGRPNADIWMDGVYRVVLQDASGATVWTRDNVRGAADLPGFPGNEGYFLSTDGASLIWRPVLQVPAVDGQSGKVLTTDGVTPYWAAPAGNGIPALVAGKFLTNNGTAMSWADVGGSSSTGSSFTVGGITVQTGSAVAPASGGTSTSVSVTLPIPLASCLHVSLTPTSNSQPSAGPIVAYLSGAATGTGFNAQFDVAEGDKASPKINNPVPFTWLAMGVALAP